MPKNTMRPIHPGEVLLEEFLKPLEMSPAYLAEALGFNEREIKRVCNGNQPVTVVLALALARFWKTSVDMWLDMQQSHDLKMAEINYGTDIKRRIKPYSKTAWKKYQKLMAPYRSNRA